MNEGIEFRPLCSKCGREIHAVIDLIPGVLPVHPSVCPHCKTEFAYVAYPVKLPFDNSKIYTPDNDKEEEDNMKEEKDIQSSITDNDPVNHPSHYTSGKIECIDFITDKKLNFCRGNAVKYIIRAGLKDPSKEIEDLEKAIFYLKREIQDLKDQKCVTAADNNLKGLQGITWLEP